MNLTEFKTHLSRNPDYVLRFVLPDGTSVPAHAHVTEVARLEKHFIDCGGTLRNDAFCRLQVWVADDFDHRLKADKLLMILQKAAGLLRSEDLIVDVEYELEYITQFPVESVEVNGDELLLRLTTRHTDCLARELCTPVAPGIQTISFKAFAPKA